MDSPPPDYLYKYKKLDLHSLQIISNNQLYFANPFRDFNDPFDSRITPYYEGSKAELREFLFEHGDLRNLSPEIEQGPDPVPMTFLEESGQESISLARNGNTFGVLSLSANEKDIVMFSHYADAHRGICLEFDYTNFEEYFQPLIRVQYERYPELNLLDPSWDRTLPFAIKSIQWRYENEWRAFDIVTGYGLKSYPKGMLTSVILGLNTTKSDEDLMINVVRGRNIQIKKAYKVQGEFELGLKLLA